MLEFRTALRNLHRLTKITRHRVYHLQFRQTFIESQPISIGLYREIFTFPLIVYSYEITNDTVIAGCIRSQDKRE